MALVVECLFVGYFEQKRYTIDECFSMELLKTAYVVLNLLHAHLSMHDNWVAGLSNTDCETL